MDRVPVEVAVAGDCYQHLTIAAEGHGWDASARAEQGIDEFPGQGVPDVDRVLGTWHGHAPAVRGGRDSGGERKLRSGASAGQLAPERLAFPDASAVIEEDEQAGAIRGEYEALYAVWNVLRNGFVLGINIPNDQFPAASREPSAWNASAYLASLCQRASSRPFNVSHNVTNPR
jgi:hypothetical protein